MTNMRILPGAAFALLLSAAAGCTDLNVPDLNNPSLGQLTDAPSAASINTAVQGMMVGTRVDQGRRNGYISELGILGRESYNLDPADPRFVSQFLIGPLDAGDGAFGGNLWNAPYRDIRAGNLILDGVDGVDEFSAEQKEAIKGFVKTIQALDFLYIINTRDINGAPVDVGVAIDAPPAPIETKPAVFDRIVQLLEEAKGNLNAGGSAFPFTLSTGFVGFDTPQTFLTFNRALLARVKVYTMDFNGALQALGESFVSTASPLTLGVYNVYSGGAGDTQNGLFEGSSGRRLLAHLSIEADAQLKANGEPDDRLTSKTVRVDSVTQQGVFSDLGFQIYESISAPTPIIRNEELILLRAEANIGLGNLGAAEPDINFIRTTAGGLDPITLTDPASALDELLYNKRYSLLWEGLRWIDVRRYNKLNTLPLDLPNHTVIPNYPIPTNETLAR